MPLNRFFAILLFVGAAGMAFGVMGAIVLYGQVLHADGPLPSFEVATIRPVEGAPPPMPGGPPSMARDEVRIFVPARVLIEVAYNMPGFAKSRIAGGPNWIDSQVFEIHAKIGTAGMSVTQQNTRVDIRAIKLMEQSLLADRFKLKVHFETRELPEYELVVAKGGAKLSAAANAPLPRRSGGVHVSGQQVQLKDTGSMDNLIPMLETLSEIGRPVVNHTGLIGTYDVALRWTRDGGADNGTSQNDGPSLFTALEEQLGLKLVATKGPMEVIVIDHIEKPSVDGAEMQP